MKSPSPKPAPVFPVSPRHAFRTSAVAWLRKTHGWVGLWGATLGLLFGVSGIWLNHRAVLPLRADQERSTWQVALPDPAPADAPALAIWLQVALRLDAPATAVRIEPARPLAWLEAPGPVERRARRRADTSAGQGGHGGVDPPEHVTAADTSAGSAKADAAAANASGVGPAPTPLGQPEHWTINFGGPGSTLQAEYWVGNRSVGIRRTRSGLAGTLMNLHKGVGMPVGWILLVDTLAGSLILLSLSGLALWILTRRRRIAGLAIFATAFAVTAGLAIGRNL